MSRHLIFTNFKRLLTSAVVLAVILSGSFTGSYGQVKFRSYEEDRTRLERYFDNAKDAASKEEWENLLQSGKEELEAQWENEAEREIDAALLEEGDSEVLRLQFENERDEAFGEWESQLDARIAEEEGKWYAARQNLVYGEFDRNAIKNILESAKAGADADEWDAIVDPVEEQVKSDWNADLEAELSLARSLAGDLEGTARESYEKEIGRIEAEIRERFDLEYNSLVYRARNSFIVDLTMDTESLRFESESKSADVITDNMIRDLRDELKEEEKTILKSPGEGNGGSGEIDFSRLGENWEEEIGQLIETGLNRWKKAQETLYQRMIDWKENAEDAYDDGNTMWQRGFERLVAERDKWREELTSKIYQGISDWQEQESRLTTNIQVSRDDFQSYMATMDRQWDDHSQGLKDIAINGSDIYKEAVENIEWLTEKRNTYAINESQTYRDQDTMTLTFINTLGKRDDGFYDLNSDPVFTYDKTITNTGGPAEIADVNEGFVDDFVQSALDDGFFEHNHNYFSYYIQYYGLPHNVNLSVTPVFLGYDYTYGGEDSPSYYAERYRFDLKMSYNYSYRVSGTCYDISCSPDYTKTETKTFEASYNWTNDLSNADPGDRPAYFFYQDEMSRWTEMRDNFNGLVNQSQTYMHDINIEGNLIEELGINGPGFLRNANGSYGLNPEGSKDPYLMTEAEKGYELARKEAEFWERRRDIARAVLDYAYPPEGTVREDAATTLSNLNTAEEAMNRAREEYDLLLDNSADDSRDVGDIITELTASQNEINRITGELETARTALENARAEYLTSFQALMVLENGEDTEFAKNELINAQNSLRRFDRDVRERSSEYYGLLKQRERYERLNSFTRLYEKAIGEREDSKNSFNAFRAIVNGEETDAGLNAWTDALGTARSEVWGDNGDARYAELLNLRDNWNSAPADEKEAARALLTGFFRREYGALETAFILKDRSFSFLHDRSFDPGAYLENRTGYDRETYENMASMNLEGFNLIREAMDTVRTRGSLPDTYGSVMDILRAGYEASSFTYGGNNREYLVSYGAYKWAGANLAGLDGTNWDSFTGFMDTETAIALGVADIYSVDGIDPGALITDADNGDEAARGILMEYYSRGSYTGMMPLLDEYGDTRGNSDMAENSLTGFVSANDGLFIDNETKTTGSVLEDIFNETTVDIIGITGNLRGMTYQNMADTADRLTGYIIAKESRGEIVPKAVAALIEELRKNSYRLGEYEYLKNNAGATPETARERLDAATAASSTSTAAAEFLNAMTESFQNPEISGTDMIRGLVAAFDALDGDTRGYFTDYVDAAGTEDNGESAENILIVENFVELIEGYRGMLFQYDKERLGAGFVSPDNSMDLDLYMDTNAGGFTPAEQAQLREYLTGLNEKRLYNDAEITGALADYVAGRGLDAAGESELLNYGLIDNYLTIREELNSGGTAPGAYSEFGEYLRYDSLERYIAAQLAGGETDTNTIVNGFITANEGGDTTNLTDYTAFTDAFRSGTMKSAAYLPEDVQLYLASSDYYQGFFLNNGFLKTQAEIDSYMDEQYGRDSFSALVRDSITRYIGSFAGIDNYYGQEIKEYMAGLSGSALETFKRYYYLSGALEGADLDAVMMPGYDSGIFGLQGMINGEIMLKGSVFEDELYDLPGEINGVYDVVFGDRMKKGRVTQYATTLVNYADKPGAFESYRRYILGGLEDGGIASQNNGESMDTRDGGSGELDTVNYRNDDIDNLILEEMNSFAANMKDLEVQAAAEVIDDTLTIGDFMDTVDGFYDTNTDYTRNTEGDFVFSTDLTRQINDIEGARDAFNLNFDTVFGDMKNSGALLEKSRGEVITARKTYNLLNGMDINQLREQVRTQGVVVENARIAYEDRETGLSDQKEIYDRLTAEYVNSMGNAETAYNAFKDAEFQYERAYAVYEYANTPYLKEESSQDSGVGSGYVPGTDGGGVIDISGLNVPDARDNYEYIRGIYEEKATALTEAETGLRDQETLATLRADGEYSALREDFVRKAGSYTRTAQADVLVNEKISELSYNYEKAQDSYDAARSSVYSNIFGIDEGNLVVDGVISHMMGNGATSRINEYAKAIECYWGYRTWKQYIPTNFWNSGFIGSQIQSIKVQYDTYNAIDPDIQKNIEILYTYNKDLIDGNSWSYYIERYRRIEYEYARDRYNGTKKRYVIERRRWRRRRDSRHNEWLNANAVYQVNSLTNSLNPKRKSLDKLFAKKNELQAETEALYAFDRVRSIDQLKSILGGPKYGLTTEDLGHVYDEFTPATDPDTGEQVSLTTLRREMQRLDADGHAVQARISNGRVYLLRSDGFDTGEDYALNDSSVILKTGNTTITDFSGYGTGDRFDFYDNVFSLKEAIGVISADYGRVRGDHRDTLLGYVESSSREGTHDNTVMLRDIELIHWNLLRDAASFNSGSGEVRQRSFPGYQALVSELVSDGRGTSVDDTIVNKLIAQSTEFQEQEWDFQLEKFNERERRWMEVVGFILNRGERDWDRRSKDFLTLWKKWRFDTREAINQGEKGLLKLKNDFTGEMNRWQADVSRSSGDASARMISEELSNRINNFVRVFNDGMPGRVSIAFDMDSILSKSLADLPVNDLGVLAKSMNYTDTSAGFTNLLNLNLSSALSADYGSQMDSYETRLGVMKNMRIADVLFGILENFNEQVAGANESVRDSVYTNSAGFEAPFIYNPTSNIWEIEVVKEHTLSVTRYDSISYFGYQDFDENNVSFKPIKGLDGEIDFTDPTTYTNIDADELNVYVKLETTHLQREIEKVFDDEGGTFNAHVDREMERLFGGQDGAIEGRFPNAYRKYMEGIALTQTGELTTPIAPGMPTPRTVIQVAGSIALTACGCPWAAFLLNAAFTAMDAKQGAISWKQAVIQTGISAVSSYVGGMGNSVAYRLAGQAITTAASGIEYESDGSVGWDDDNFREGVKRGAVSAALTYGMQGVGGLADIDDSSIFAGVSSGLQSTVMSGIDLDGNWRDIGFDTDHMTQHITTGVASGVTSAMMYKQSTGNSYMNKALSGLIDSSIKTLSYKVFDGKGFSEEFGMTNRSFNWDSVRYTHQDLGRDLGQYAAVKTNNLMKEYAKQKSLPKGKLPDDPLSGVEEMLGGIFLGMKQGMDAADGFLNTIKQGVGNFFERTGNLISHGEFTSASDLGMSDKDFDEWMDYKDSMKKQNIEVEYTTGKIDTSNAISEGSLDYFNSKIQLGYYEGDNAESIHITRNSDGNIKSIVEGSVDRLNYEALKYSNGELTGSKNFSVDLSEPSIQNDPTKSGAKAYTDAFFKTLSDVSSYAEITGKDKFQFTVNNAKDHFSDMNFQDQTHLNNTFAGVMENLGSEFEGEIKYGYQNNFSRDGSLNDISRVDCSSFVSLGVNVMGLADKGHNNINLLYGDKNSYEYADEFKDVKKSVVKDAYDYDGNYVDRTYSNGPVNILRNDSLFERFNASEVNDYTGLIGVTMNNGVDTSYGRTPGWYDHVYVNLGNDNGIVESTGGKGIYSRDYNPYEHKTSYYLQLRLNQNRRLMND